MARITVPFINYSEIGVVENMSLGTLAAALVKLKRYEDAEEGGLLVRLPCKVGDTVYVLRCGLGANFLSVYPSTVIGFKIGRIENTIEVDPSYQGYSECYSAKDWGVYVFPTREEAEASLERRNHESAD